MTPLKRVARRVRRGVMDNIDLVGLFIVLAGAQCFVPVGHMLARDDLMPWMLMAVVLCILLRGRAIGNGPHPQLTIQRGRFAKFMRKAGMAVIPVALLFWHDATYVTERSLLQFVTNPPDYAVELRIDDFVNPLWGGIAVALTVASPVLMAMGRNDGLTAWDPPGPRGVARWIAFFVAVPLLGLVAGLLRAGDLGFIGEALPSSALIGAAFVISGSMPRRPQDARQRRKAGRKDGKPWSPDRFPAALAVIGPGLGMMLLMLLFHVLSSWVSPLDFTQSFIGVAHVAVWAAVVWQRPEPIARACMLWEVVPSGGGDKTVKDGSATGFEAPPEGALRFNPLRSRRINLVHAWIVPVRAARIGDLDDPIRDLWAKRPPYVPQHILGECAFEPDPLTRQTQDEVITLRMQGQAETTSLGGGDAQARRLVILRSFVGPGTVRRARTATYRWDQKVPEGTLQILDASVDMATLMDGDIIIMSSEGVGRAYEVEIGAPIYTRAEADAFRPPQLEDYVKV